MDDLVSDFAIEAAESLASLQGGLAALSLRREHSDAAGEMRRRLHGLKGLCGFAGLVRTETVAHAAEGLIDRIVRQEAPPSSRELALVGDAIHRIAELIAFYAYDHVEPKGDDCGLIQALETAAASPAALRAEPTAAAAPPAANERRSREPWSGLDGLARGLGDRLGKRIELVVGGDNVRIERSAAAPLRAALIALVRNACDHGVEAPAERRSMGKNAAAVLQLTVRHTADGVAIDLVDDGRGVDPHKVRERSVASGCLSAADAAALNDEDCQALVFTPGLSTAADITSVSGRGLGLEVVRREVDALGGTVEMASTPGRGARFTLRLPKAVLAAPTARRLAAA